MKKSLCMVVAMFILCMLQVPLWGQNLTVSQIQQDIKTNGAQWEAGETSMTKLSPEERKMRLGLVPLNLTGKESKRLLLTASPVAIPPTLDWRNNGGNYVTSVKNQGQCGSCWAFGTTATLESAILLHRQTPNVDLDLSEQVMISCGGFGNCNGGDPVVTSDYFVTTGLPPESCYPYTATYGNCAVACANWQAKAEKASDWWFAGADASHAGGTTVDAIKAALYTYGPLASTMSVYEDFYSYRGGVYQHVSGSLVGGHEISIIGYDDVNKCFIAKNSWGTGWGEAGFFRIAYSQVPTEFGGFTIGYYIAPTGCSYTATLDQGGPYYLFPGSGAKGTVTVKADSGCAWTTLSVFPWATITSGASGTGNGTVSFSLDDYPTGAARMGGLIVAGQNVFFQQQSQTPCAFAPWPAQISVGAAGGNQSLPVTFTSGQNCPWFSVSFGTWVTATPYSGTGNGTLNYSVAPNTGPYSRTLSLQVAMYTGNSFAYTTILQAGSGGCIHSISSANPSFAASGGTGSSNVTTGSGCAWTATSNTSWITVTGGSSGSGNGTVNYSVGANTGAADRFGTITIAGQTLTVYQRAGAACTYAISPTSQSLGASSGTGSVSVTTGSGCTWQASSGASWITVTGGSSGSGNGTVNYSVAANTGTDRSGTLTIAGQTFTVTQAAGSPTCTYAISPTSNSLSAAAGTGSVSVTAGTGCAWTAASNASWITVTSGSSGSGNGSVGYSVTANTTTTSRTSTLTIGGQTLIVNQSGATCTYAISPTSQSLGASSGTGSVSVTAGTGCAWTAASNATSWLTVTGGASGSGNGTVGYSVAANTGTTTRNGTITIAGQTFTVNQTGQTCTYALNPTSQSFTSPTGTGTVNVTSASGCSWTAVSNATSWLSVTSGASGSGNGSVGYAVTANTTTTSRSGTLTIAGQTFTVSQAGQACTYSISPASNSFSAAAGAASVGVACSGSSCSWTAVSNATSWLSVTSGASGSGNGTVGYAVTANATTTSRNGTLTIGGQTFSVTQAAQSCTYSISPTSNSFAAAAGTGTVSVTAGTGCAWTATSNATSFLNVTSGASGSGNGTVGYSVAANSGTTTRNGTITIAGQTFTVNQAGQTCTYALNPTSKSFTSSTGTGTVSVTSASGCAWSATSNNTSWLTVTSGGSGAGSGTVSYSVIANTSTTSRTGTLTIGGQTYTVTQAGGTTCTYTLSPTSKSFTSAGGTGSVNVTAGSGCTWQATSNASWILVNYGPSGSGNGTVGYLVAANTNTSSRTGTITIGGQTHTVSQTGQSCSYSISPSSNSFTAAAGTGSVSVTASSGCAWTAASNTSWLTVTGGSSGSGNGTVGYSVAANSGTSSRTGTMTIAGQTFTVNQTGQTCTYALNPTSQSFTSSTGAGTVNVTSASGCAWTAVSNATSWLTVTSGSSGSGSGTVSYSVLANTTTTSRTGNLTVGGQTFTVTQAGGTVCTYTLSPTSKSFTSASGAGSVSVTTSSGCAWSATSNNTSWLTVTSGGSGSGNGTVNYSVIANTSTTSRTGTLTIGGQTHTVAQAGGTTCTYSISPTGNSLSAAAGTGSVSVTAASGCAWTATSNNTSWLTVTSGASGSGNGTVGYSVAANATTALRTGTLTIAGQTHTVTQAGGWSPACKAYVWPDTYSVESSGLTRYIGVGADSTCKWTVTSNASWIIAGGSGQGNGTFLLMVQGNSGPARTGTFSVNGTVVTITEKGAPK